MKVAAIIIVTISILALSHFNAVFANGIKNRSTQSFQAWGQGSARYAEIEDADTPLHNLAGSAMMEDGWHFHLSGLYIQEQTTLKNRSSGKEYTLKATSIPPYAAATYKNDKWAGFFTFSLPGGIASGELDRFPAFDAIARIYSAGAGTAVTAENQDISLEGGIYAFTLGGAYRFNDTIAVGYGLRRVTHFENVNGKADYIIAATGTRAGYTIVDYEIEGSGIGHSFGLDWKFSEKLNFGFRYDMEVDIDAKPSVSGDDNLGVMVDGDEYSEDLPAVFNAGVKYQLSDTITIDGVFNYYFQKGVDMMGGTAVTDKWDDAYDIGMGLSYKLSDAFELSTGINYSYVEFQMMSIR